MSRYPFPAFPRGWYRVAASSALGHRGVLPLRVFGRELVLWRTNHGHAQAHDAHCPHQGAHLGHGGVVAGEALRCPFHGWVFGTDGAALRAPGCAGPPRSEPLRKWPVLEQDGDLLIHFDPTGAPPAFAPPPLPEASDPAWVLLEDRSWRFRSHVQEVIENLVDAGHFPSLHRTPGRPRITFEADGDRARITNAVAMASLGGPTHTDLVSEGHGLGVWFLRFAGIEETTVTTHATPLDEERVEFRLAFRSRNPEAGQAFAKSVLLQVDQDERIWEHKVYRANPPLTEADGPILPYRAWASRFYDRVEPAG